MAEKANKIALPKGPSLLEAWMGYIYSGNSCENGIKALKFLRECLSKGILTNKAVWEAASEEIKTNFYKQFGLKTTNSDREYRYRQALSYTKNNLKIAAVIRAEQARVAAEDAKRLAGYIPYVSGERLLSIKFRNTSKKTKKK